AKVARVFARLRRAGAGRQSALLRGRVLKPRGLARSKPALLQLTCSLQHRVSNRTDVRVNALKITQHVQVQRTAFDTLWATLAQPCEMIVCSRKLRCAQIGLFLD